MGNQSGYGGGRSGSLGLGGSSLVGSLVLGGVVVVLRWWCGCYDCYLWWFGLWLFPLVYYCYAG